MHRAVAAWLLRPIAGDGPGDGRCEWGWTQIDDACFKVTQGIWKWEVQTVKRLNLRGAFTDRTGQNQK